MLRYLASLILSALCLAAPAYAQDDRDQLLFVYFTHSDCPPAASDLPGSTPQTAIDVEFDEPWQASARFDDLKDPMGDPAEAAKYECRWVRLTGFMTWKNYYHYRADLFPTAGTSYTGDEVTYIVENFASGSLPRSDLVRRKVTLVGKFYNLCDAAERERRESGKNWTMLFGPCHYGHNYGMMLDDVRVEKIHDGTPQYILGEINRPILASLVPATADESREIEPVVRAWVTSSRKGPKPFADEYVAQYPDMSDDEIKDTRDEILGPDSYESYLLRQPGFMKLDLHAATIRVFRTAQSETFDEAYGCICLKTSCTDRWPLTTEDAARFLGDAACVALDKQDDRWRW